MLGLLRSKKEGTPWTLASLLRYHRYLSIATLKISFLCRNFKVVLAAGAYVSFAGIANILFYNASNGQVNTINGEWNRLLNGPTSMVSSRPRHNRVTNS